MPQPRKPPAAGKPARAPRKPKPAAAPASARVLSVFGPFRAHVLVEMSADDANGMFPGGLGAAAPAQLLDAILADLEAIRRRAPELADSALAATAVAMAKEIEHPFNSATSKSMCARVLADTLETLRELAPPQKAKDRIDEVAARRAERRSGVAEGSATAEDSPSS